MAKTDQIDVRGDGRVVLYKRSGLKKPVYQARIRVPNSNGYKIVTTKTGDLRAAERFALNLYEDLYMHVRSGGSIKSKTFKQVFEEWVSSTAMIRKTRQGGSWDATVERIRTYAVEFFGSKRIDQIGSSDFSDYWVWRASNFNRKAPSSGTLKRERTCLLPVFKHALAKGYIQSLPETNAPKAPTVRRPTFTVQEGERVAHGVARLRCLNDGYRGGWSAVRLLQMPLDAYWRLALACKTFSCCLVMRAINQRCIEADGMAQRKGVELV